MMTRSSQATEFLPGSAKRIARAVAAARAVLAWERLWPALWPASGIFGLGLTAALFDLFAPLPWPLHALVLACFTTAMALALTFNLENFSWPRWEEGARRLERDSALENRPISEADDTIAAGAGDPTAEELWRAHRTARLSRIERLRLKLPHSDLPARDPKALRFVVLVLILFGVLAARGDILRRLESAFSPNAGMLATLDAWINPPAYTGQVPVYLTRGMRLSVPAGSTLNLRVHGADHLPSATLDKLRFSGGEGEYAAEAKLTESGHIRVRAGGHTIGSWKIAVIPDKPPFIAFADKPAATERQALKLTYKAGDDYGVVVARAIIKPHGRPGAPLVLDLQAPERGVPLTVFRDLTDHPYAGLQVDITLQAVDALGQTASSSTVLFRLPQRSFTDPLARALVEQRQNLASEGARVRARTARTLDALTIAPDYFFEGKTAAYLSIRSAFRSLGGAETAADYRRVEDLLWQTALGLEQNGLLSMAEQLRAMQQVLLQMLATGAPQAEIDAALQRYTELMQRYLAALAANAPQNGPGLPNNARVLGAGDLDTLLKAIETLSQSGDRLKAMQLLSMLQSLLENIQVSGGTGEGGDTASEEALRGLSDLMGKERLLLDKTFRQSQGTGDAKDGGAKGLSQQQGKLKGDLGELLKKFRGKKAQGQENLDKAGRLMGDAQSALALSDFPRATTLQKYVLDELSKSGEAVAKAAGQGKGQARQDPLGRALGRGNGAADLHIPDAAVLQRARDILMELRKRAGQQGRSKQELDYIDRLLKQF
jgi:uncharacterized protein (TIGR02302 family)